MWSKQAGFTIAPLTQVCGSVTVPQKRQKSPYET